MESQIAVTGSPTSAASRPTKLSHDTVQLATARLGDIVVMPRPIRGRSLRIKSTDGCVFKFLVGLAEREHECISAVRRSDSAPARVLFRFDLHPSMRVDLVENISELADGFVVSKSVNF